MLVTTMNDVPGATITKVIGEVSGLTVRSRNFGVQFGAGLKSLGGGELKGLTTQLEQTRAEAVERLVAAAEAAGGNAIIAMRYDSNELDQNFQEVVAYGTAVILAG
jgi:uncharacterized protein YbjQ (UPF0145 family)